MRSRVLGVDVGTGSTKAVVFDVEPGVLGAGSAAYPIRTPAPSRAEQDPSLWWDAVGQAVRAALAEAGGTVEALAVSGQGAALVALDAAGDPVYPALIHLDQRAVAEARSLSESAVGAAVAAANGNRVGAWNIAAKLAWLREHEPQAYAATRSVTSAAGFILRRLTGRAVQSDSDAGVSDLFDLSARAWSDAVLSELDIPAGMLPEIAAATDDVGELTAAAAAELGLPASVRVVAGGEDASSAALASGVVTAGDGFLTVGTAGVVGTAVPMRTAAQPALLRFPHVRRGLDIMSGSMTSAGSAVSWCAALTGADVPTLLAEAADSPPGARGVLFLPYLAGELHPIADPEARGVFAGLSLSSTRADLARAVLEGSAGAIAHNLAVARSSGAQPRRLLATGRPTGSAAWMQAIADATGVPVDVVSGEGAPVGDAMLAAAGSDATLPDLIARHVHVRASYHPDSEQHDAATERRAVAAALYQATKETGR